MLNPVVGFEPVIQTETPVVTEPPAGNFTTPVQRSLPSRESKISEKEGTSKSVEAESTEPQPAKLQARPSQNLDSINEEQEVVKFKQAPVKKNTNPDGCQARPCTATFDS